jgi:hypothetical protein
LFFFAPKVDSGNTNTTTPTSIPFTTNGGNKSSSFSSLSLSNVDSLRLAAAIPLTFCHVEVAETSMSFTSEASSFLPSSSSTTAFIPPSTAHAVPTFEFIALQQQAFPIILFEREQVDFEEFTTPLDVDFPQHILFLEKMTIRIMDALLQEQDRNVEEGAEELEFEDHLQVWNQQWKLQEDWLSAFEAAAYEIPIQYSMYQQDQQERQDHNSKQTAIQLPQERRQQLGQQIQEEKQNIALL